jgi:hypothetical protein
MRKIERLMNDAITNGKDFKSGNTQVHQTATTKSRLNAILAEHGAPGECVFQHKFEWFIRLWNGTEFFTTEFRNSMKLGALPADLCLAG